MSYTHNVVIELGLLTSIEFTAVQMDCSDSNCLCYSRYSEEGEYLPSKGMIVVNLNMSNVVFSYDIMDMKLDIVEMKKVDNNYHLKCVNDLLRVDVYICDYEKWSELERDIFIS